jgi:pro-apoptotic serine protease NMA111
MTRNGSTRPKRKASIPVDIPPPKREKSEAPEQQKQPITHNGEDGDYDYDVMDVSMVSGGGLPKVAHDSAEWQRTIEQVVKSVVSIRFCQTCSFDTDSATTSEATGFVVDSERGYILTNRHVACAGPFWGYCVFDNHEEVFETGYVVL